MKMVNGVWRTLVFATGGLTWGSSQAATIEWGSRASATEVLHVDSGGDPLAPTINIELGVFPQGFDPVIESPTSWMDSWITLDIASYNATASYFSESFVATPELEGRQAYIWLYTDTAAAPGSEWALITAGDGEGSSDWVFPGAGDQTEMSFEWRVSLASEVLFGATVAESGLGVVDATPPVGFELQTFSFAPPVPEPSVSILLGAASLFSLRRRRARRRSSGSSNQ